MKIKAFIIKHQEQLLNCLESNQSASSVPCTPSDGPDTPDSEPSPSDSQQIPGPSSSPIEIEEINWETRGTDSTNQMAYFRPKYATVSMITRKASYSSQLYTAYDDT